MPDVGTSNERKEIETGAAPGSAPGLDKASAASGQTAKPDGASEGGSGLGEQDHAAADKVAPFPVVGSSRAVDRPAEGEQGSGESNPVARLGQTISRRLTREERSECLTAEQVQEFRRTAQAATTTDETIRQELSLALGLAQRIRSRGCDIDGAYERIRFIFDCLVAEPPKLVLASDERLRLQVEAYRYGGLISRTLARISSGSPAGLVLAAVAMSTALWGIFVFGIHYLAHRGPAPDSTASVGQVDTLLSEIFFMNGKVLAAITSAAFVGGVVSIATRLGEFSQKRDLDPFAMFWTAMLKPLIGVVLSLFLLATLAGGIVSFGFLGEDPFNLKAGMLKAPIAPKVLYTLWALGFLSGFSERFARDFVDRAEGAASGGVGNKKPD